VHLRCCEQFFDQWRVHRAGNDDVRSNSRMSVVGGNDATEGHHSSFRSGIGGVAAAAHRQSGRRADQDERTLLRRHQQGQRMLGAQEGPREVNVDRLLPHVEPNIRGWAILSVHLHPGANDDGVQAPKLAFEAVKGGLGVKLASHIQRYGTGPQFTSLLLQRWCCQVEEYHRCALIHESVCDGAAKGACSSCHRDDLAVESHPIPHRRSPDLVDRLTNLGVVYNMEVMRRATTLSPLSMRIENVDPPVMGSDQARIRVSVVGLCGSDYHLFSGKHPYAKFPLMQGHEFSGVVLELGELYHGPIAVGDIVVVEPLIACGTCFACRRGRYNCCAHLKVMGPHLPGALAEEVVVPADKLFAVGDLDIELAALVEPVSIGLQTVVRGNVAAGDTVVILGAGPIGLAAALAASDLGAHVLVADQISSRLEMARTMGAERVVDTSSADLAEAVDDFTANDGAAIVIDATGVPALIRQAFDLVAYSGAIVIVGISDQDVSIPVIEFSRKEVTVYGSRNNMGLFERSIELVRRHQGQLRSWITHRVSLDDVPEMIEYAMNHPESVEKMLVHMKEQI